MKQRCATVLTPIALFEADVVEEPVIMFDRYGGVMKMGINHSEGLVSAPQADLFVHRQIRSEPMR